MIHRGEIIFQGHISLPVVHSRKTNSLIQEVGFSRKPLPKFLILLVTFKVEKRQTLYDYKGHKMKIKFV